jgi:hypothetical protein
MEFGIRMLGALVVTYVLSRVLLAAFGAQSKRGVGTIMGAHLVCFVAIAIVVGFLRAAWNFEFMAAAPYVLPQIFWLAIDIARKRR